jgi:hypothetical protein
MASLDTSASDGVGSIPDPIRPAPHSPTLPPSNLESNVTNSEIAPLPVEEGNAGAAPQTQGEARQALYADPVARRIFNEFEARLVEVRIQQPAAQANLNEPEAEED